MQAAFDYNKPLLAIDTMSGTLTMMKKYDIYLHPVLLQESYRLL